MSKLRVGIIGCGGIAQKVHIPNYLKCSNDVEVIAVCDVNKETATICSQSFNIPYIFNNYYDMLKELELDIVSVCTPNKFHANATIAALEAGCHVFCEKPPAMSVEEAKNMAMVAERTNKFLTYGFHYRFSQEVSMLKRFIDNNELGHIYAARSLAIRRRGIPGWGMFTNKELQGGGPLIDIGVHMLDSTLYLMGYPEPELVLGTTYQKIGTKKGVGLMGDWDYKNFSVEDMARGMITFKDGSSIILETAFAANVEKEEVMQISLMGDQGGADVFPVKVYQEKHDTLIDITPPYLSDKDCYELQFEKFVECCVNGTPPLSTPKEGVILQKIINALYESAEKGEAIKLTES